jgi:hypothetical protein
MPKRFNVKQARREFEFLRRWRVVSIFWVTETQARARRLDRMQKAGAIRRERNEEWDAYPYCVFVLDEGRFEELLREVDPSPSPLPKGHAAPNTADADIWRGECKAVDIGNGRL